MTETEIKKTADKIIDYIKNGQLSEVRVITSRLNATDAIIVGIRITQLMLDEDEDGISMPEFLSALYESDKKWKSSRHVKFGI